MPRIIVLGAAGTAGRATVAAALARGHQVTAFVRDAAKAPEATAVVEGDITDAAAVAEAVEGHDVAVDSIYSAEADPAVIYPAAAEALIAAAPPRLIHVTLSTLLELSPGTKLADAPDFPEAFRAFSLGHGAGLNRITESTLDWTAVSPTTDFDRESAPTGSARVASLAELGVTDFASAYSGTGNITYADFATGILDEIENPRHRKVHIGLTTAN
ncbi:NAD(P)H-binding protein [Phytomonospora sp. NPDC050363]|uniref:NAD(P)-dependent oxidoreductase n=1 Tax=Phytomonospora sp. NPDC050363 TaxID=3155642 RepID=UPI003409625E